MYFWLMQLCFHYNHDVSIEKRGLKRFICCADKIFTRS